MRKLPAEAIENWVKDNFEYKEVGKDLNINSIFGQDKKFRLGINAEKGVFNCFKTGESGIFWKLVCDYYDCDQDEAEKIMREYLTPELMRNNTEKKVIEKEVRNLNEDTKYLKSFNDEDIGIAGKKILNYTLTRIPKENIDKYKLMYCYGGRFADRLIIPFFENSSMVYFIARSIIKNDKVRYLNPKADKTEIVFNIDNIKDRVYIFEGVIDAITLSNGVGTALLGATIGKRQCQKIIDTEVKEVVFVPDNDEAGKNNLFKNIDTFKNCIPFGRDIKIFIYLMRGAKDLNEQYQRTGNSIIEDRDLYEYTSNNKLRILSMMR
jgi:DNA primase